MSAILAVIFTMAAFQGHHQPHPECPRHPVYCHHHKEKVENEHLEKEKQEQEKKEAEKHEKEKEELEKQENEKPVEELPVEELPFSSNVVIGVNGAGGWGERDAKQLVADHITGARVEQGGPYESVEEDAAFGFRHISVIVGNTPDSVELSSINQAAWVTETLKQIEELKPYYGDISDFEVVNEPQLKGEHYDQPAVYASMYIALDKAVTSAKLLSAPCLGFTAYGDYQKENGEWSQVYAGHGWNYDAVHAQPELAKAVQCFVDHPYGLAHTNKENDWGPEALEVQHEQLVKLGFVNADKFYLTEFGVQLNGGSPSAPTPEAQAADLKAIYEEFLSLPYVKGTWYYQLHDDSTGKWGLVEQHSGNEPWVARPAFEVLENFAILEK